MNHLSIFVSSSVPPGVRGAMNQWMLEVLPGVFVGKISAKVRDYLWRHLSEALVMEEGAYAAILRHSEQSEQGFTVDTVGDFRYELVDADGLTLVTRHRRQLDDEDDELNGYVIEW
jgi:CRISPR-associated protein Cas2